MNRYEQIAEKVVISSRSRQAFKGQREAQWLLEQTGGFRGALYALADIAGIEWRDQTWARKIAKILMGTGNTIGRIEESEMAKAASDSHQ